MLEEHGMTSTNPVVTPDLARNDDDEDGDEANTMEQASGGQESVLGSTQARHRFRYEPSGEVRGKTYKSRPPRRETSVALPVQAETAAKSVRISWVPGPENIADATAKPADRRSLEFFTRITEQFRDPSPVTTLTS